ncbi:concanavalin A-like lectin/glucanase [Sarocladium strictum]
MPSLIGTLGFTLAAIATVSGQDTGACDPTKGDCPPVSAFGRQVRCDFTEGPCGFVRDRGNVTYGTTNGAELVIEDGDDLPLLVTPRYLFFGKVEFEVRAAGGQGLITTALIQSRSEDEITWTMFGSKDNETESNYYAKGDIDSDNSDTHETSESTGEFHNYTIEWTSRAITWSIDNKALRKIQPDLGDSGDSYPQTPMQVRFGSWVGGKKDSPDEVKDWAGGVTSMKDAPFKLWIKSITVTDYAGGSELTQKKIKQYEHTDQSGTYESIKAVESTDDDTDPDLEDAEVTGGALTTSILGSTALETPQQTGTSATGDENETDGDSGSLTSGVIAGIAVGSVAGISLISATIFFLWRRKRAPSNEGDDSSISEIDTKMAEGRDFSGPPREEMDGVGVIGELPTEKEPVELDSPVSNVELESPVMNEPAELESPVLREQPAELESPTRGN